MNTEEMIGSAMDRIEQQMGAIEEKYYDTSVMPDFVKHQYIQMQKQFESLRAALFAAPSPKEDWEAGYGLHGSN